ERFRREARTAAGFTHPHVVTVHDFGVAAGTHPFLVMELLSGVTLREELRQRKRLTAARTLETLHDVQVRRYDSSQLLTTEAYLAQRRTHSDVISLAPETREDLLSRLEKFCDSEHGGSFTRHAETILCTARAA